MRDKVYAKLSFYFNYKLTLYIHNLQYYKNMCSSGGSNLTGKYISLVQLIDF